MISFYEELRCAILNSGLRVSDIARKSGVTSATIYNFLNNAGYNLTFLTMASIVEALGLRLRLSK